MPVLDQIAYFRGRRDEVPNQELARRLAEAQDSEGIREIADNLWHKKQNVQSDCLKVLYEIGYLKPELITDYAGDFLKLLKSRNNRMVWGGMIALTCIADLKVDLLRENSDAIVTALEKGTLITLVWGVKTLAKVAASDETSREKLFPVLMNVLKTCIPRDVPLHAESSLVAVDSTHRAEFVALLEARLPEMTPSQQAKVKRILKKL